MPATRGVLYIKWGDVGKMLDRALASVRQVHPELDVHVQDLPPTSNLNDKARLFEYSPFDETVFLDLDTVVMSRLDYAFERAQRHGLACALCPSNYARRHVGLRDQGDLQEYNTGVLFFTRAAEPLFRKWAELAPRVDATVHALRRQDNKLLTAVHDDQASFALAMEETRTLPYVLTPVWNFRPRWHRLIWGPIKVWHDYTDVPPFFYEWTKRQSDPTQILDFFKLVGAGEEPGPSRVQATR
jgi:hypothetical protein